MPWALAMTVPRSERRASAMMARRGIEHRIFYHRWRESARGQVIESLRPAFPGYAFVNISHDAFWRIVIEIPAVLTYVFGGHDSENEDGTRPLLVDRTLDMLMAKVAVTEDGLILPLPDSPPPFVCGDSIFLKTMTAYGRYQCALREGRSIVLMPWLGRSTPVEVDDRDIEKRDRPKRKHWRGERRSGKKWLRTNFQQPRPRPPLAVESTAL